VKKYPVLFSGDTLFKESFGRTDFPTGSEKALFKSIAEKLLVLPEDTTVFPGHEGQTSIGNERRYNPAAFLGKLH
jgi:glyoxylase-like metal-dependent hydrolase (beta-lactamase superfamily II)